MLQPFNLEDKIEGGMAMRVRSPRSAKLHCIRKIIVMTLIDPFLVLRFGVESFGTRASCS